MPGRGAIPTPVWAALAIAVLMAPGGCDLGSAKAHKAAPAGVDPWSAPVGDPVPGATLGDGWHDLRVLPGPVNVSGGWTDSVAATPDGLHLYFAYTQVDFTQFNQSGTVAVTGPLRDGMTDQWFHMFRADLTDHGWEVTYHPLNFPQDGTVFYGQASASVNAAGDLLVYSQFDPSGIAYLQVSSFADGAWSTPINPNTLATPQIVNAACQSGDDNGFVIGSIDTQVILAWESRRNAADGTSCEPLNSPHHLYWTTFTPPGAWSMIEPIPGLNTVPGFDNIQVSFTPDAQTVYFTSVRDSYGIYTANYDGSTFANVHQVVRPTLYGDGVTFTGKLVAVGEANVAILPQGELMYMMCGIANSESLSATNFPDDVTLKVCVARR